MVTFSPLKQTMYKAFSLKSLIAVVSFLLLYQGSIAQCTGNVLFYEDFGGGLSSPLTGSRLPSGVTTYTFDSLGLVEDGQYGIRKTTADIATGGRQFGAWHIGTDRSGGNMMIVNADFTTGKHYYSCSIKPKTTICVIAVTRLI